jgi:hypothetical protein
MVSSTIVSLHAASLLICVLTFELQKLDAEAAASPSDQFLRTKANSDYKEPVEAPLAPIGATGKHAICISNTRRQGKLPYLAAGLTTFPDYRPIRPCPCERQPLRDLN